MPSLLRLATLLCLLPLLASATPPAKGLDKKMIDGIPQSSEILDGYDNTEDITRRMSALPLHPVEGIWRFAAEGTLMAIERTDNHELSADEAGTTLYRMVVVRAVDHTLRPGTVMGYLSPTAKRGVYDARIYSGQNDAGTKLHSPTKTFTLTLGDSDSRLVISNYGKSLRFNWWRLFPYMYRYIFTRKEKSPGEINGCLRVYPAPAIPASPRYL
ncbi:MAG: hypothetical protein NC212_04025 [Staphylococcus sp.]|nr:hypothetical protein [Staphylococcus sp.]